MEGSLFTTQRWFGYGGWFAVLASLVVPLIARSEEQVVVLRNGRVLTGEVLSLGDMFLVSLGERGEVQLPKTAVEMICTDLEQAYQRKRAAVVYGDLPGHLNLATWSLRNGLFARAADQLLVVYSIQPNHPGLEAACRALDAASPAGTAENHSTAQSKRTTEGVAQAGFHSRQPTLTASDGSRTPPAGGNVDAASSADPAMTTGADNKVSPASFLDRGSSSAAANPLELPEQKAAKQQAAERQASHSSPATMRPLQKTPGFHFEQPTTELARSPADSAATQADQPELVNTGSPYPRNAGISLRNLPVGAVEQFTKEVQPYLLNRCATNACHGSDRIAKQTNGPRLTLTRPRSGEAHSRRRTEQNLANVLQFVDRRAPEKSLLLTVPAKPHGDRPVPLLDSSAHFLLHRWLRGLGEPAMNQVMMETDGSDLDQALQSGLDAPAGLSSESEGEENPKGVGSSPSKQKRILKTAGTPDQNVSADQSQKASGRTEEMELADAYEPRDPFDPEIFNRRWLSSGEEP